MLDLRTVASTLGGEVVGNQVLCPGPGHSPKDRSLAVLLSHSAPGGIVVYSHARDDWRACSDHVRGLLGLPLNRKADEAPSETVQRQKPKLADRDKTEGIARPWAAAGDPRGTIVERYLASRLLDLPDEIAGRGS
jgi:hypothetical protein